MDLPLAHRELDPQPLVPSHNTVPVPPKPPDVDAVLVQNHLKVVAVAIASVLAQLQILGEDEQRRGHTRKGATGGDRRTEREGLPCHEGQVIVSVGHGRVFGVLDAVGELDEAVGIGKAVGVGVGEGGLIPGGFLKAELHDTSFLAGSRWGFFHYITKTAGLQEGSDESMRKAAHGGTADPVIFP